MKKRASRMGSLFLLSVCCSAALWVNFLSRAQNPTPTCPSICTCVKWEVNCRRRNLYQLPANIPPTTRELSLSENHFTNIPPLEISYLNELVYLDWSLNDLEMDWEFIFPGIDKLSYLDLSFNKLTSISPHTFSELHRLTLLNLSGNPTIKQIDEYAFAQNPLLTYLDISDCGLENFSTSIFRRLWNIQAVGMKNNPWNCECSLLDFITWLIRPLEDRKLLNADNTTCSSPANMSGIPILKAEKFLQETCYLKVDLEQQLGASLIACGIFLGGTIAAWLLGVMSVLYYHPIFRTENDEDEGEYRGI